MSEKKRKPMLVAVPGAGGGAKGSTPTAPKKRKTRVVVKWVNGYNRGGKDESVYEGEHVGVNVQIPSSIGIFLVIDQEVKDGRASAQESVFLPHTFIDTIRFEEIEVPA